MSKNSDDRNANKADAFLQRRAQKEGRGDGVGNVGNHQNPNRHVDQGRGREEGSGDPGDYQQQRREEGPGKVRDFLQQNREAGSGTTDDDQQHSREERADKVRDFLQQNREERAGNAQGYRQQSQGKYVAEGSNSRNGCFSRLLMLILPLMVLGSYLVLRS